MYKKIFTYTCIIIKYKKNIQIWNTYVSFVKYFLKLPWNNLRIQLKNFEKNWNYFEWFIEYFELIYRIYSFGKKPKKVY